MVDSFNFNHIVFADRARIIAGPFAEGSFRAHVIHDDLAFNDDLSLGRHRQAGKLTFDDLKRHAAMTAGMRKLTRAISNLVARREE